MTSSRSTVAKILAKGVIDAEAPSLVLCGKQAIDNDMNATGSDALRHSSDGARRRLLRRLDDRRRQARL